MIKEYTNKYNIELKHSRHDKTMLKVKETIGRFIRMHSGKKCDLLEIGAERGWQTMFYRSQLENPQRTTIYDWKDQRLDKLKNECEFYEVDLEKQVFPEANSTYDVVVCNQVFEHLKNIFLPLSEIHRIIKPSGILILSVPNICALHNVFLMSLGRQPTTMQISGSHVRGYAIWSMSHFLTHNSHFKIRAIKGIGLHPFTSIELPSFLRTYCHTPVWLLQKRQSDLPTWKDQRDSTFTTTNF